jgi:dTDP-4-amino-4,6-dideoxygalactose transaminase
MPEPNDLAVIPFNRTGLAGPEFAYIREAIADGHISGDGAFASRINDLLQTEMGAAKVLLTTSCTHALEMSALLIGCGPGDEIIMPSFTFVSTANAFVLRGATPVFVDIRADTLNIDEAAIEAAVTSRTRAIVVVHYAGVACEMDTICAIAARHDLVVIEDNAHGLFGTYRGRQLGTIGALATQSFHETKNFSCGEGGALVVNDPKYIDVAEIIREKGTNRKRFFRGQVDKYSWVMPGSSYLPSDILAAFLLAQLEARETIQASRERIWHRYDCELSEWATANGVRGPVVPAECGQSFHMYYVLMPDRDQRDALIRRLRERNIISVFHYVPLHTSEMGRSYGYEEGSLPVTESTSDRLVRLPFYNDLSYDDQSRVIDAVRSTVMQGQ